jgi:tetratricopeptide (TPR) repeat protein
MRYVTVSLAALVLGAACAGGERQGGDGRTASAVAELSGAPLGTVQLAHSCSDDAVIHLERGVALLHSMTYEESAHSFVAATEADSTCAMGYWGQAMTFVHPLWSDPPDEATFARGKTLVETARTLAGSDRERAYVAALASYYDVGRGESERPNLAGLERGWQAFHEQYPDDTEGATFYALAQLGTADPADKTYTKQQAAGALAARVLEQLPDHPGAHHYIIHAYDNPALAAEAAEVARSYREVAPSVPHALHMPTHTLTRLGLWQESIEWNRRSADAALERPVGGQVSLHYFHALDYLAYAYLQGAQDEHALAVLRELQEVEQPHQVHMASAYTLAAVPARLALERHQWEAAADLTPRQPEGYPWETAPAVEAITHFARALGAARSGRFEQARADLAALAALEERVPTTGSYNWRTQVEVQRLSALAWLQFEEGDHATALATMSAAADLEATTEKHPITPGEVLPARELLGDMLLELERPTEAVSKYEEALGRSPNRFNSLYGAGRAAELGGDTASAVRYYQALLEVTAQADSPRERLEHARAYVEGHPASGG